MYIYIYIHTYIQFCLILYLPQMGSTWQVSWWMCSISICRLEIFVALQYISLDLDKWRIKASSNVPVDIYNSEKQ